MTVRFPEETMLRSRLLVGFLSTCALLSNWVAAQVAPSDLAPQAWLPGGGVRGAEAIAALGSDLAEVAAAHGMEAATLEAILRRDDTLWVNGQRRLVYIDSFETPPVVEVEQDSLPATESIAPEDALTLHSRPGSTKTIYLDFTGHHSVNNGWLHDIIFLPYNTWGYPSDFTTAELSNIITWWRFVAEDFAPFDVDVTTEEPATDALTKTSADDEFYGVRCVITQPKKGFLDGVGGVANLWCFGLSVDTPVFVFSKGKHGSSISSHEIGHALGLLHDGQLDPPAEYYAGTGSGPTSWGPIMGAQKDKSLSQWNPGDYPGATNTEDDFMVITTGLNGASLSFLPDDHGDVIASATPLVPPVGAPAEVLGAADGRIGRREDVDVFTFVLPAPDEVIIRAELLVPGTNLDVRLDLLDAQGQLITTSNPAAEPDASIIRVLPAGAYAVSLDGVGLRGTYSDYGSLGEYALTVTLAGAAPPPHGVAVLEAHGTVLSNDMPGAVGRALSGAPASLHLEADPTGYTYGDDSESDMRYAIDFSASYMIVGNMIVPWKAGNSPDLLIDDNPVSAIKALTADGETTMPGVTGHFGVVASSLWGSTDLAQLQGLYPDAAFSSTDWAIHYQGDASFNTLQVQLDTLSIAVEGADPTWIDLGNGSGYATLEGTGPLYGGMPMQLAVDTPASRTAALVVGFQRMNAPFKGGIFVPSRDVLIKALPLSDGAVVFGGTWPSGIPSGLSLYFQIWANDPTDLVPAKVLSSNAVEGIAH
jgi:hypothetical protein